MEHSDFVCEFQSCVDAKQCRDSSFESLYLPVWPIEELKEACIPEFCLYVVINVGVCFIAPFRLILSVTVHLSRDLDGDEVNREKCKSS